MRPLRLVLPIGVLAIGLLLAATQVRADDNEASKKALAAIQGEWTIESVKLDGADINPPGADANFIEFTPEHIKHGENKIPFKIFADSDPKLIDLRVASDTDNERTLEGIYKVEGDNITMCVFVGEGAKERPDSFEPSAERIIVRLSRKQ